VGVDISFDLELIKNFQLHVYAFDPSPQSIEWLKSQRVPDNFHFYPYGLADTDGVIKFVQPDHTDFGSLRITDSGSTLHNTLALEVHKLDTILRFLGHSRIDILKMDIEGAEYSVIDDIVTVPVKIDQLLIEFHHRFIQHNIRDTKKAVNKLNQSGYFIFNVSPIGEEFSFIRLNNS
jgi:FkbM family methyltransferase